MVYYYGLAIWISNRSAVRQICQMSQGIMRNQRNTCHLLNYLKTRPHELPLTCHAGFTTDRPQGNKYDPTNKLADSNLPFASTIGELRIFWTKYFTFSQIVEPESSVDLIIAHTLGYKTLWGLSDAEHVSSSQAKEIERMCNLKITTKMPVQYIIGEWDFRDLTLVMRPPVLIPRPETECESSLLLVSPLAGLPFVVMSLLSLTFICKPSLVPKLLHCKEGGEKTLVIKEHDILDKSTCSINWNDDNGQLKVLISHILDYYFTPEYSKRNLSVLEMGCGSGAVILSLAKELPNATCSAIDMNPIACNLTQENARRLGLLVTVENIVLSAGNTSTRNASVLNKKFDIIVSNPPYIKTADIIMMDDEIKRHEDVEGAIHGGHDGLSVIRIILSRAAEMMHGRSTLWLETDIGHAPQIESIVEEMTHWNLRYIKTYTDFLGKSRFCLLNLRNSC